ncbi:MAG: hypothetical protein EXS16_07290 [Gemmataceae bacterium]|nr:hypothetical protein [Gemmataceae bacterium]
MLFFGLLMVFVIIMDIRTKDAASVTVAGLIGVGLLGFLSLGSSLSALAYSAWRFCTVAREVSVDKNGLRWKTLRNGRAILWTDVESVWRSERITLQESQVADWSSSLIIEFVDETNISFDHSLTGYKELAAKVQYFTHSVLVGKKILEWQ